MRAPRYARTRARRRARARRAALAVMASTEAVAAHAIVGATRAQRITHTQTSKAKRMHSSTAYKMRRERRATIYECVMSDARQVYARAEMPPQRYAAAACHASASALLPCAKSQRGARPYITPRQTDAAQRRVAIIKPHVMLLMKIVLPSRHVDAEARPRVMPTPRHATLRLIEAAGRQGPCHCRARPGHTHATLHAAWLAAACCHATVTDNDLT